MKTESNKARERQRQRAVWRVEQKPSLRRRGGEGDGS